MVVRNEGIGALWKGIQAAWLRESSYTSIRIGMYAPVKKLMGVDQKSSFAMKFLAGSVAGAMGSLVGNPFDVLKTRMMVNQKSGVASGGGLFHTGLEVFRNQGLLGLYRGLQANIMRAMVLNGTKMSCYDQIKGMIKQSGYVSTPILVQFYAAFVSGFFMAVTVTPFDYIRTQLMNQPLQQRLYSGFLDCVLKTIRTHGFRGLYFGFVPIWMRFAPNNCIQLVIFEQVKSLMGISDK